ncbi:hypothetical protein BV511_13820 [Methylorubrum extorquens]|uniref:hypothetical protein n=1 Tax=Methylorubrum extorquens TaxID=408 RepID=UPI000972ADCB|nr:hypothetical protein [Methylorubrum extorquens]APX85702.1 hypothetical protein BV511_13820 [Methylorubrum extorquens]
MTMHGRYLSPLYLREFDAAVLAEALESHLERSKKAMIAARDRADRRGWALARERWLSIHSIWTKVEGELRLLGPMQPEGLESLEGAIRVRGSRMPRSAANADTLRAEAAAKREAEEARKARLHAERGRHERGTAGLE